MHLRIYSSFVVLMCMAILHGCSSIGDPLSGNDSFYAENSNSFLPAYQGTGALGVFELSIITRDKSAELTPVRNTSSTDVLEVVDITNFLRMAPCTDCARIESVELDIDGNVVVSIGIKHPFPAGDPFKPITGRNRGDLHVFNVEGMVVSNNQGIIFGELDEVSAGFKLINADGYSSYLDEAVDHIYPTDATVHPYILHFDDYSQGNFDTSNPMGFESVTDPPPSGNLVMAMGCDYDYQDYVFDLSGSEVDFIFVVECTYAISAGSVIERFTPEYRIPQHNKKSASEVKVSIVSNNLSAGDTGSTAEIEIHVVDISHGVQVGDGKDEMFIDSSVDDIFIDIPGILVQMVVLDGNNPASGSGHEPSDPLIYNATITNEEGAIDGVYYGLVKVTDNYPTGGNTNPLLEGKDGIKRVDPLTNPLYGLFNIDEFATYTVFKIPVALFNEPPVAVLSPLDAEVEMGGTISWNASASYDPDGIIELYEFDFDIPDGDPANFSADVSGTESTQESDPYDQTGTWYAAVRVTDNLGGTDITVASFEVVEVLTHYWTQFMSNKNHNGQTNMVGPQTNHVEWTYDGPGIQPLIVIEGYDGTLYFGSSAGGRMDAVNPDGTEKWYFPSVLTTNFVNPMGISADDSVLYVSVDPEVGVEYLAGLDTSDGTELWTHELRCTNANYGLVLANGDLVASGATGPTGANHFTVRIDKDGNEIWRCTTSVNFTTGPTQGLDGSIYARDNNDLIAIDPDTGDIVDSYSFNCNNQTVPAVRSDGSIVFGGNSGSTSRVYCLNSDLEEEWVLPVGSGVPIRGFGIGLNDEVYLTFASTLFAIASDGSHIEWTRPGASGLDSPAVDANGTIYIGTSGGAAAYNPNGSLLWSLAAPTGYGCAPMIAHDGALYVNISSTLYKVQDV